MKKLFITSAFFCFGFLLYAQLENIPLIKVDGEGVIYAKPDYAILAIKINRTIRQGEGVKYIEIFRKEDTRLQIFGFDERDIDISYIRIEGSGYVKEIFITINDLNKLDKILLELNKLGYSSCHFFEYRLNDFKAYKEKATSLAIASAKIKASEMAKNLGQEIGKAHTIEEINFQNYNWYDNDANKNDDISYKSGAENYMLNPGYITITSRIRVSFDLIK